MKDFRNDYGYNLKKKRRLNKKGKVFRSLVLTLCACFASVFLIKGLANMHEGGLDSVLASQNNENLGLYTNIIKGPDVDINGEVNSEKEDDSTYNKAVNTGNSVSKADNTEGNKKSDEDEWKLILINKENYLPDEFNVKLVNLANGHAVDERIYEDLQKMMDDARALGLKPTICSSYRTMEKQTALFTNKTNYYKNQGYSKEEAEEKASFWVARPGTSEHHTGLALDIVSLSYQVLDEKQATTEEQKWLMENCYKYGFILRYPSDKSDITGIGFEPWHYRYVGKEAAADITSRRICLEEYLNNL